MNAPQELTEPEVRALRDHVYGHPISDKEWHDNAKVNWMKPDQIAWLKTQKPPLNLK